MHAILLIKRAKWEYNEPTHFLTKHHLGKWRTPQRYRAPTLLRGPITRASGKTSSNGYAGQIALVRVSVGLDGCAECSPCDWTHHSQWAACISALKGNMSAHTLWVRQTNKKQKTKETETYQNKTNKQTVLMLNTENCGDSRRSKLVKMNLSRGGTPRKFSWRHCMTNNSVSHFGISLLIL